MTWLLRNKTDYWMGTFLKIFQLISVSLMCANSCSFSWVLSDGMMSGEHYGRHQAMTNHYQVYPSYHDNQVSMKTNHGVVLQSQNTYDIPLWYDYCTLEPCSEYEELSFSNYCKYSNMVGFSVSLLVRSLCATCTVRSLCATCTDRSLCPTCTDVFFRFDSNGINVA